MENTLVLDVGMQPVRIIPWQEGIVWVFERIVRVIDEYPRDILTPNPKWAVPVPSVVQFIKPLPRRRVVKFSRQGIYARDRGQCQYCGVGVARHEFTYDHVVPRTQGGRTEWGNVVVSCVPCNQRKGGRTPAQAGMRLHADPVKPKNLPDLKSAALEWRPGMPDGWRDYLRSAVYWGGDLESDAK